MNKSDFEIRKALQSDMTEVARVFRASFRHALSFIPELHTPLEDENYFHHLFAETQIFVACDRLGLPHGGTSSDKPVGSIVGFIAFTDSMVNHLYLSPSVTGLGLGGELLGLAKAGSSKLQLWAFQKNEIAKRFYIKNGFAIVRETDGSGNEENEPDFLFEWSREG